MGKITKRQDTITHKQQFKALPSHNVILVICTKVEMVSTKTTTRPNNITKAPEQGNAQRNLGVLYHRGNGVSQDYDKAKYYYELAANQGNACAQAIQPWCSLQ